MRAQPGSRGGAGFASRVAWATGAAIAIGSAAAALATGLVAQELIGRAEDRRLFDAASILAYELREEPDRPAEIAEDETREQASAGILVAVYARGALAGGDRALPPVAPGTCEDHGALRVCARRATPSLVAVAALPYRSAAGDRSLFFVAAALAAGLTSLAGALVSIAIARWAVAPLVRLRRAVDRVSIDGESGVDAEARLPFSERDAEGVAEIESLRATLASLLERLGAALGQSRRFARDAAHELRTPLTAILGELELLIERGALDAEDEASAERVRRTAARLAQLVERLLVLATPAAGARKPTERVGAIELIEDARAELAPALRDRVRIEPGGELLEVVGDRALLAVMIGNVIDNACKFGGEGAIAARVYEHDGQVIVEVDDQGPGVPEAERERVFAPFHRIPVQRDGAIPGHGIGLALVAHVAALHGGRAAFVGGARGARLRIELPGAPP